MNRERFCSICKYNEDDVYGTFLISKLLNCSTELVLKTRSAYWCFGAQVVSVETSTLFFHKARINQTDVFSSEPELLFNSFFGLVLSVLCNKQRNITIHRFDGAKALDFNACNIGSTRRQIISD